MIAKFCALQKNLLSHKLDALKDITILEPRSLLSYAEQMLPCAKRHALYVLSLSERKPS